MRMVRPPPQPRVPRPPRTPRAPRLPRIRLTGIVLLFIYVILAWFFAGFLKPEGGAAKIILVIVLWVLGFAAAGLIYWFMKKQKEGDAGIETDEIDNAVAMAEAIRTALENRGISIRPYSQHSDWQ